MNASVALDGGYSGGSGTEVDPYQISNTTDWITLTTASDDWDKHFVLKGDLDFAGAALTPVGDYLFDQGFKGTFEGDGHVMRNVQINFPGKTYVGLFGCVSPGGVIRNLTVENISVSARYDAGCLVGRNQGMVTGCRASGDVMGDGNLGCLSGANDGSLDTCSSSGTVTDRDAEYSGNMGCLVGLNGLSGIITACHASGTVIGSAENSFAIGGLAGMSEGALVSCYAFASISGRGVMGGLVGFSAGTIATSYAVSLLTWTEDDYIGGLVGHALGVTTASYWDAEFSGMASSEGGEARTTDEMTSPHDDNTYVEWDFAAVWADDTEYTLNKGYPYLRECPPPMHPADLDADWRMRMSEAITYMAGWQHGGNPMSYAIRAAYLWQNGEYYAYDNAFAPPLCWAILHPAILFVNR